jgi:tagatose 1,6-diphosphate aldolase
VWKTGDTRIEAETGRTYISQNVYIEDEIGHVDQFEHSFYLQSYSRSEWIVALHECGFEIKHEYRSREKEAWHENDGFLIIEAVKNVPGYRKYTPKTNLDHLRTPIYKHSNVALYNDFINLEQPNNGVLQYYRFSINAEGKWVGWIQVKIGYSLRAYYDGQIGYMIDDENDRNKGYATDACLALKPFLCKLGYDYITITTDENNTASRRVCEKIGAELLDVVDTPTWTSIYKRGQRRTCIFEWKIDMEDNKNG